MKRNFIATAILLKGFSSVIAQTILIRELLIVFNGNELTFCLILSIWLIAESIGSGIIANLFKFSKNPLRPFCLFQILWGICLPLALMVVRESKSLLHILNAETLSLGPITIISLAGLLLVALSDGTMFTLSFRLIPSLAKIYFLECVGVLAGGLIFTYILLTWLNSFQITSLISSAMFLSSGLLLLTEKKHKFKIGAVILFIASFNLVPLAGTLQKITLAKQWPDKNLTVYKNSAYGNIAVTKEPEQYTVFYNGIPTISVPAPDIYFTEDFIHIPMIVKPGARKILFIGSAIGGLLKETLKYPVTKIVVAETDPVFIKTLRGLGEPSIDQEVSDPRVAIVLSDARQFIRTTGDTFDHIFVNVGLPTSLAINRYYTKEFYHDIKKHLAPGGLAIFKTWGSLAYLNDAQKKMNASLYTTLLREFPYLWVIPGDHFNLFLASGAFINPTLSVMKKNWQDFHPKTTLINPKYLDIRLQKTNQDWLEDNLHSAIATTAVNEDLKPTGLYEGLNLYYAQFSKNTHKLFGTFKKSGPIPIAFCLVIIILATRLLIKHLNLKQTLISGTILSTGFFAMSYQMIVLFVFQSLCGYLFSWLAILTASFMFGASLGALYTQIKTETLKTMHQLSRIEIIFPLITTAILLTTIALNNSSPDASTLTRSLLCLMSISTGALSGLELPVCFSLSEHPIRNPSKNAGTLYSLDLLGACGGAILTPLILIPSYGIIPTALLLCLLKWGNGWNIDALRKRMD